jgi:hypothetical protein
VTSATGDIYYNVLDGRKLTTHAYVVEFGDTRDSGKAVAQTTYYSVRDTTGVSESLILQDTSYVRLSHQNIITGTLTLRDAAGNTVQPSQYILDYSRGQIRARLAGGLPSSSYTVSYQYYPVFRSPFILGSPFVNEAKDADIFDGVELSFKNDWEIGLIDSLSGWSTGSKSYGYSFSKVDFQDPFTGQTVNGLKYPADYEIRFADGLVDSSSDFYGSEKFPVNFRIWNSTDNYFVKFVFNDADGSGGISANDQIYFFDQDANGKPLYSWYMQFSLRPGQKDTVFTFKSGEKLTLKIYKPFRKGDLYRFATVLPKVEQAAAEGQLERVKVVPNPYIAASTQESPLPPNITSGRGIRRIDFIHLPVGAKIHIFTSRGEHVITLEHQGNIDDGSVSWNLKSKDNLDVAYGVYFYIVESSVGNKSGKLAIIK